MRRLAALLIAVLWLAPAGLRIALSDADSEALRCALACGHAVKAGAACCPVSGAAGKSPAMSRCPDGEPQGAVSAASAQPAVLASVRPLAAPEGDAPYFSRSSRTPPSSTAPPPDHVPLLLS